MAFIFIGIDTEGSVKILQDRGTKNNLIGEKHGGRYSSKGK